MVDGTYSTYTYDDVDYLSCGATISIAYPNVCALPYKLKFFVILFYDTGLPNLSMRC